MESTVTPWSGRSRPASATVLALATFVLVSACSGNAPSAGDQDADPTGSTTTTRTGAPFEIDCVAGSPDCPEIMVEGDPPALLPSGSPSPLRGYADPSIRRDPEAGELWMAYSWPSIQVTGDGARSTQVDTHLARSDDGGASWTEAESLWEASAATNAGGNDEPGVTDHEVPNLLPVQTDGGVVWYGVRLDLFGPDGEGLGKRPPSSFRIVLTTADSPEGLGSSPSITLGSTATAPAWGVDTDLTALDPSLDRCTLWNEPALHFQDDTLFLAMRCLALGEGGVPDLERSSLEVFATSPPGEIDAWDWRYVGQLTGHEDAVALGGSGLTQIDFAVSTDGSLLALVTPDTWSTEHGEFIHHGVRVLEVTDLDPPTVVRNEDGQPETRAAVTASDLDPLGPGAAAYEPTSSTGLILTRRVIEPATLVATMHATGIHP